MFKKMLMLMLYGFRYVSKNRQIEIEKTYGGTLFTKRLHFYSKSLNAFYSMNKVKVLSLEELEMQILTIQALQK